MASDVVVMECPRCGRLWVGSYENDQHSFTEAEMKQLAQVRPHAKHGGEGEFMSGIPVRCYGIPESVQRSEVMAAFLLAGKWAAEALADGTLRQAIEAYEERTRGT